MTSCKKLIRWMQIFSSRLEFNPVAVIRDRHLLDHAGGFQLKRQIGASQQAVVDGLHVDRDDLGIGCSLARCDYIIGGHGDGITLQELCSSAVDDNDVRLVLTQGVLDIAAPDGVSGDIESGLTVSAEDE